MTLTRILAERFCAAPVPLTECADPCASMQGYPNRTGTNYRIWCASRGITV